MKVTVKGGGDETRLEIRQSIGDEAGRVLEDVVPQVNTPKCTVDLAELNYINSRGIRFWLMFLERVRPTTKLTFVNCPTVFIDYRNVLPEVARPEEISTFLMPFSCVRCNHEEQRLFDSSDFAPGDDVPNLECLSCRAPMKCGVTSDFLDFIAAHR